MSADTDTEISAETDTETDNFRSLVLIISKVIPFRFIDAHRMKIQGEGVAQIFDWRVKAFWENCPGASPILAFIAFLLRSFWKI